MRRFRLHRHMHRLHRHMLHLVRLVVRRLNKARPGAAHPHPTGMDGIASSTAVTTSSLASAVQMTHERPSPGSSLNQQATGLLTADAVVPSALALDT